MAIDECKHLNEKGMTTQYKEIEGEEPEITCTQCDGKLTRDEFRSLVEYVAKCYEEKKPYV